MSRGAQKEAKQQLQKQNQYGADANTRGQQLFSSLFPSLENQYANPVGLNNTSGYTPEQTNEMTTASNQSLGGAVAGAVGQGNLQAARTRNSGGYATALDDAVRQAGRQQSQNVLGIHEDSAKLSAQQQEMSDQMKSQEREQALSGMEGLYGQNINELMQMMGLGPQAINSEVNAGNSGWLQNTIGLVNALGNVGQGVGSAATGISKL